MTGGIEAQTKPDLLAGSPHGGNSSIGEISRFRPSDPITSDTNVDVIDLSTIRGIAMGKRSASYARVAAISRLCLDTG